MRLGAGPSIGINAVKPATVTMFQPSITFGLNFQEIILASFTGIASQVESTRSPGGEVRYLADQILGASLFFALTPLIVAVAFTTWCLSRRSPFVAHRRVGQYGELFWMLKLRTMWMKANEPVEMRLVELVSEQPVTSCKNVFDDRVTSRFARFCRRYSIDELPQLWHVVRGQMALIGPRPITRLELTTHYGEAASEILRLRPGLSGLWQVMGRSRLSYRQRRRLDVFLARHFTMRLYLRTLWRTIPSAIRGADAW